MSYFKNQKDWLNVAQKSTPNLIITERHPISVVQAIKNPAKFQGWEMKEIGAPSLILGVLQPRTTEFILDFGEHIVGSVQFSIGLGELAADAPLRLHLTFGEAPCEVAEDFEPFQGELSRSWLQDEIITIDEIPCRYSTPRRYAFRYLKIKIQNASPYHQIKLDNIVCKTITSADIKKLSPAISQLPKEWQDLDAISIRTLANCMHTVFEDGPKRDRRLWVGDLRLQAQANYETFKNNQLVKRCLYLFAGLADTEGKVMSDLYERPVARKGNTYLLDYGALFPVILYDYFKASGDRQTALDLWNVALHQFDFITNFVNEEGYFKSPEKVRIFIDWCTPLHRQASMHAVLIYSLRRIIALAKEIGEEKSVASHIHLINKMHQSARKYFWDSSNQLWVSGETNQVSWANWAWMVLAEVCVGEEAKNSYRQLVKQKDAIKPNGPYLYHHVVDALFTCGLENEAKALLKEYWGGMIAKGATTFWEIYNPQEDNLSPYNSHHLNSYCHAWSCTPTYFIRKYICK
jgi:hypothetical protein